MAYKSSEDRKAYAREWARNYRKTNPDAVKNSELKKAHGITLEDYKVVLDEQGGICAICHKAPGTVGTGNKSKGSLAVDHCHESQTFRGLLCTNCNLGIGSFFENPELLKNAALYLEAHRKLVTKLILERTRQQAEAKAIAERLLDDLMSG